MEKKCKNTDCCNTILGKNLYCSFTCRNIFVNKNLRDYSQNAVGLSKKAISEYGDNQKICENPACRKIIPYKQRKNRYCSSSCGAIISNIGRCMSESTRKKISERNANKESKGSIKCKNCSSDIEIEKRILYCDKKCRHDFVHSLIPKRNAYYLDCRFMFKLSDYHDEFDFKLIEEHGWYSPRNKNDNLGGVSRDHIFSVREGYRQGIDPSIISHPANCRLMVHSQNISKFTRCDITLDELKLKIENWNKKYNH